MATAPARRRDPAPRYRCDCGQEYQGTPPSACTACGSLAVRPVQAVARSPRTLCVTYQDARRADPPRWSTGMPGLDRVLGGGLVRDGVVLLAGQRGAGKSTLLGQIAGNLAATTRRPVLYASGEESAGQILARVARIGATRTAAVKVLALDPLDVTQVLAEARLHGVASMVVDSLQKCVVRDADGRILGGGSRVQRALFAAEALTRFCKAEGCAGIFIGQYTAEGDVAGTEEMQHLVDAVGELTHTAETGDRWLSFPEKNRFGATGVTLRLEMGANGLHAVPRTAVEYLRDHRAGVPGAVVYPAADGPEVLLCAVGARVFPPPTDDAGKPLFAASPKRPVTGLDDHYAGTLLQVLQAEESYAALRGRDIFLEASGEPGKRLRERSVDLAMAAAVVSSLRDSAVPPGLVVFGPVGIHGEVQRAPRARQRMEAALDAGYRAALVPAADADAAPRGLAAYGVAHLSELDVRLAEARGDRREKSQSAGRGGGPGARMTSS